MPLTTGLSGKGYSVYTQEYYDALDKFADKYRTSLFNMIQDIIEIEHKQCGGEYFLYGRMGNPPFETLSDSCITLGEIERIFTKIHDRNSQEL